MTFRPRHQKPYVIAINAVSGGGKTALANLVQFSLPEHYVEKARYPYLDTERHKATSDVVLDGCRSLEELKDEILQRIRSERTH